MASIPKGWMTVLIGASVAVLGELGTVVMLDHGILSHRWQVYVSACVAPAIAGALHPVRHSGLVMFTVGTLAGTVAFYRAGVQTHIASDLANDFDWAVLLAFLAGATLMAGVVGQAIRAYREVEASSR